MKTLLISLFLFIIAQMAYSDYSTDEIKYERNIEQMQIGMTLSEISEIIDYNLDNSVIVVENIYELCHKNPGMKYAHRYVICLSGFDENAKIVNIYDGKSGTFVK